MTIGGQRVIWASALAGTLGATMLAGGCGSEGARRSKTTAQFMASASRVCRFEQDKLASIRRRAAELALALSAPHVIRQQARQSQLATTRLEELPKPPADAPAIDRWLTARTVAATVALDLAEAPARGEAAAVRDVVAELARVRARARRLALGLGIRACGEID
jgi:hypothetical protein